MCNSYEQRIGYVAYQAAMRAIEMNIPDWQTECDLPQADDIRIIDLAPVMRAAGDVVELAQMRFGFPSQSPKGGPVFNFPIREPELCQQQAVPDPRLCVLRVHRREIPEDQAPLHPQ